MCFITVFSILQNSSTVPNPFVLLAAPNTQIAGQSLTLECSVTTVRGITSRVDIVWNIDSVELRKIEGHAINSTTKSSVIYTDTYTITQLNTTNEGQTIQCMVVINGLSPVMTSDNVTLDVTGKLRISYLLIYKTYRKLQSIVLRHATIEGPIV